MKAGVTAKGVGLLAFLLYAALDWWLVSAGLSLAAVGLSAVALSLLAWTATGPRRRELAAAAIVIAGWQALMIIQLSSQARVILLGVMAVLAAAWTYVPAGRARAGMIGLAAQYFGLAAIFMAAAVQPVPAMVLLGVAWGTALLAAEGWLAAAGEPARWPMAAAWALVAAELAWVLSRWLVHYSLLEGAILVSLPVLIITAMAYCMGGIYSAHQSGKLSRARLAEYMLVGAAMLVLVVLGTDWHSTN